MTSILKHSRLDNFLQMLNCIDSVNYLVAPVCYSPSGSSTQDGCCAPKKTF